MKWYRKAAKQGNDNAKANIESLSRRGTVAWPPAAATD